MKPPTSNEYLNALFKGHEDTLKKIASSLASKTGGSTIRQLSEDLIKPIIGSLEKNVGAKLDPGYVGYMVEFYLADPKQAPPASTPDPKGDGFEFSFVMMTDFKEFVEVNLPRVMPTLKEQAERCGMTFSKNYWARDSSGQRIPIPDVCADSKGDPTKKRVSDWIKAVISTLREAHNTILEGMSEGKPKKGN